MKYVIAYCLSFFFTASSLGQKIEISESLDAGRYINYQLIAEYEGELLVYYQTKMKHWICALGKGLKELWKKELQFDHRYKVNFLSIITNKKSFYFLYYTHKKNKTELHLTEFDARGSTVAKWNGEIFDERLYLDSDQVVLSSNKKFLVVYKPSFEGYLHLAHVDIEAQKISWKHHFKEQGLSYTRHYLELLVNPSGGTYLFYERNNHKSRLADHRYEIYYFDTKGTAQMYKLQHPNRKAYDINFEYDRMNDKIVVAGLYSAHSKQANGLFYTNFALENSEKTQIKNTAFDEKFMRNLTGKRRKNIEGVSNFEIQEMILRRDGGVILMAEQNLSYEYEPSFFGVASRQKQSDFLFENILVASIHPTGQLHWKKVLYKKQSSENDEARYSSFFLFKNSSALRVLYNSEITWSPSIYEYVLKSSGEVDRNMVTYETKKPLLLEFRNGLQLSANTFAVLSTYKSKLSVVKVIY